MLLYQRPAQFRIQSYSECFMVEENGMKYKGKENGSNEGLGAKAPLK